MQAAAAAKLSYQEAVQKKDEPAVKELSSRLAMQNLDQQRKKIEVRMKGSL